MEYQALEVIRDGALATVWLNRPDVRNAFNETTIAEITAVFNALDGDATVRADALDATVQALVSALVAASPHAVAEAKRLVHDMTDQPLTAALVDDTVARIADIRASEQGRDGVQSFLEKRKPSWLI